MSKVPPSSTLPPSSSSNSLASPGQQPRNTKKLAVFFKDKEKPSNRFKSILSFVESSEVSEEEEKKFFHEHYEAIFTVLYDRFVSTCDGVAKRGQRKTQKDLVSILGILKKILVYLANVINTRWQIEKIGAIIEKSLWRGNLQQIRLTAFDLLIHFIEALQNSMEAQQIELFATAINLTPFIDPNSKLSIKCNKLGEPLQALLPSIEPASKKDAIDMLDFFLDFISNKSNNFLFWFNLFKDKYLMTFYPKIFQELRLLDKYDESGFKPYCPHDIQGIIIDRLSSWGDKTNIFTIIWDSNSNAPIMLEIHRQSCMLPLSCAATINKSIQVFRSWLVNFQKNKIFAEQLQTYWQQFIKNLALVFGIESTIEEIDSHHNICKVILFTYNYFAVELSSKLTKETWEVLQYTMLISTFDMLNKTSPNSSNHSVATFHLLNKTSPNPQKAAKIDTFADHLFASLYFFWIRSQITNSEMWKDIAKKVQSLTNWKANLLQWKEKVLQLTHIVKDLCYLTHDQRTAQDSAVNASANTVSSSSGDQIPVASSSDVAISPTLPTPPSSPGPSSHTPAHPTTPTSEAKEEKFRSSKHFQSRSSRESMSGQFTKDPRLTQLHWTPDTIIDTWSTMLHILGNFTKISDPISHEIALSCVYEVVRILVHAEEKLPLNETPPVPIMKIVLPWLIEASVYDDRLIKGLLLAYRTLCVLFCRRQVITPELTYLLSHFYRIIQMGLNNVKSEVIWEIIEDSLSIFSFDLPGVSVLIPDFLREIEVLCGPQTNVSSSVKQNALVIVNSLICYPNHFNGLEFPVVAQAKPYESKKENNLSAEDIREKISKILLAVLTNLNEHTSNTLLALCGSTVLIFEELNHPNVRGVIVNKFLSAMLDCVDHNDEAISQTTLECLSAMTSIYEKLCTLDKGLIVNIVTVLCDKIITLITQLGSKRESIVSNMIFTLRDWLICEPNDLLSNKELVTKVYQMIEYGLLGEIASPIKSPKPQKDPSSDKAPKKSHKKGQASAAKSSIGDGFETLFDELKNSPTHGSFLIREAAEITLLQLLNHYNNFPSVGGPEVIGTHLTDYDDHNSIHFVYNDLMVISLTEVPVTPTGRTARIIIRDSTGRYAWDSTLVYDDRDPSAPNVPPSIVSSATLGLPPPIVSKSNTLSNIPLPALLPPPIESNTGTLRTSHAKSFVNSTIDLALTAVPTRNKGEFLKFTDAFNFSSVDMLGEIISFFTETDLEGRPFGGVKALTNPEIMDTATQASIQEKVRELEEQQKNEEIAFSKAIVNTIKPLPTQNMSSTSQSTFHLCRLLLSHLGFFGREQRKRISLVGEDSIRFMRSLKELDLLPGREIFKIGVIYVAPGQEDQRDVLKNSSGSPLYNEFLRGIGWLVDLKTHSGYMGGLDRNLSTGKVAPYYSTSSYEVMFHVPTLMPLNPLDDQQIDKKKHVGNDYTHIVWSEHKRDYKPTTISSQFNEAHIIIYPLPNGLFRVQIFRKEKIPFFGPLLDGMVVNKRILCSLVRQTSINASRRARALTKGYQRPYPTRNAFIKEVIQRFKSEKTFDEFLSSVYPLRADATLQDEPKVTQTNSKTTGVKFM